ncbi:MAG: hypothetical protein DRJ64_03175 [Thermoprotei archaeon]|nr:MAG: hypothetical protein DRJ64_03175 [Thermoprotei archaeon]
MSIANTLETILFLPLIGSALILMLGKRIERRVIEFISSVIGLSLLVLVVYTVITYNPHENYVTVIATLPLLQLPFANLEFLIDPLSLVMLLVVSLIGFIVIIYSIGYMSEDPDYSRYYSLILLFLFGMSGLVISGNFFLFYMFWEVVGFCSFSLIGFWYMRPKASRAGIKAFITTRIGDTLMLAGIILLFLNAGTLSMIELMDRIRFIPPTTLNLILLLLFAGSVGKSAQFPLHVWLPDAMEGPTTVSALIHAATMVKAGVYLIARVNILILLYAGLHSSLISTFSNVVLIVGILSSFLAATIAITQYDLKGVLAYSTISQLGYMFTMLGLVSYIPPKLAIESSVVHLTSHAVFKALLFLSAGCIIHSIEPILGLEVSRDIRYMGGFAKKMPSVALSFLFGALALSGFPPFNGFWSKDFMIENVMEIFNRNMAVTIVFVMTSFLSVIYILRVTYLVFFSKPRRELEVHKPPRIMTYPILILAILTLLSPFLFQALFKEIKFVEVLDFRSLLLGLTIVTLGVITVYAFYVKKLWTGILSYKAISIVRTTLYNAYYIDYFYEHFLVPAVIWVFTQVSYSIDLLINKGIESSSALAMWLSMTIRRTHNGRIFTYVSMYILGLLILLISSVVWRWIP